MTRYLLDTNHLSAYLDRDPRLVPRLEAGLRGGDRFGITLPVLCEYRTGIALGSRYQRNLGRLQAAMALFRLWPVDAETAVEFADITRELRQSGRILPPFDTLIAASARQFGLTLLTADADFHIVSRLSLQNWLL